MAHGDVRGFLSRGWAYERLQTAVGSNRSHARFLAEYVEPRYGERLLDLGCGPAHILGALPAGVAYVGVDPSDAYIDRAKRRWGDRGEFRVGDGREPLGSKASFDVVLAMGVLHHLDDAGCAALIGNAARSLAPGGRFVTIDPARAEGQPRTAAWLIGKDRGSFVRTAEAYAELARGAFGSVRAGARSDLLRVPYTHAVLVCTDARREHR
jgi:SAM-dependent methyltransferase